MDNLEEQKLEIEALQSIYLDEFELIDNQNFKVKLFSYNFDEDNVQESISITLAVQYCANYPLNPPKIIFEDTQKLKYEHLLQVKEKAEEICMDCLGSVCIFSVIDEIRDLLTNFDIEYANCGEGEFDDVDETCSEFNDDSELNEKSEGLHDIDLCDECDRVTEVEFLAWAEDFKNEMIETGVWSANKVSGSRLTGKELFECDMSLVNMDEEDC